MELENNTEIIYKVENQTAKIFLNRPEVYNSFNKQMMQRLIAKLEEANQDPQVRAVLITGNGKAFCAGQDLSEVLEAKDLDFGAVVRDQYNHLVQTVKNLNKPVIAAVNGVAAGAGANLALACDIILAKESAKFIQAFSKIGLIPDTGGTYFLPRLIGHQKAAALMLLGDPISAPIAKDIGMIYDYFKEDEYEEKIHQTLTKISQMPTLALVYTKKLLNMSAQNSLEQQLEQEAIFQTLAGNTEDYQEGVQAFLEKRNPIFKGN